MGISILQCLQIVSFLFHRVACSSIEVCFPMFKNNDSEVILLIIHNISKVKRILFDLLSLNNLSSSSVIEAQVFKSAINDEITFNSNEKIKI